ncbi:LuxR family transcriptional regulator [Pseudactinotalea sp. Z1732]|uniref:LuxR family transcriptional regulator n=1 Tax=Micrococcales TaxID=85006 RepID=UPI003C7EB508
MDSVSLADLGTTLLQKARSNKAGRAARTIHGGREHVLRQTLIALAAGRHLGEHDTPEEATLQVLSGQVRLHCTDRQVWVGRTGEYVVIPPVRHDLGALEEAVVLLTSTVTPHRATSQDPSEQEGES